jgi:hypothetical protein
MLPELMGGQLEKFIPGFVCTYLGTHLRMIPTLKFLPKQSFGLREPVRVSAQFLIFIFRNSFRTTISEAKTSRETYILPLLDISLNDFTQSLCCLRDCQVLVS